ncbi:MAG: class I SAM-dependent methyltransferase [Candidatus Omnitrophica bacterium]|nr:class I SAM-dependent methyltransferase [Candidatus Omnitrophota bacterium]MBI2174370.1 class I SAM-dependent methyltransferase [Candidatus Omnitrophota bacterium]
MRTRTGCRLCAGKNLDLLFSLEPTPPANAFVKTDERHLPQERFPLNVHLCTQCGHVQLLDIVDPEVLFRDYVYVSSTSPVFVEHFRQYAEQMRRLMNMPKGSQVLEIGSNDGTLLRFFKEAGMTVLGVDPARSIAMEANRQGIETRTEFFDETLAARLKEQGWQPLLVVANNVFAHADDLGSIADGIADLLREDGLFTFEVSYLRDVFEKTLFDTIYHEHLSYHSIKPLVGFFERHGLELVDAQRVSPHGGSLRGFVQRRGGPWRCSRHLQDLIAQEEELGLHRSDTFRKMFEDIEQRKEQLRALLTKLRSEGKKIAGFGAPAKATTLLYHFGLDAKALDYIIDDSPWKQGLYTPGQHIPVVAASALYDPSRKPDYLVILAWNFSEPVMRKHSAFQQAGGHFIIPLPCVEVI